MLEITGRKIGMIQCTYHFHLEATSTKTLNFFHSAALPVFGGLEPAQMRSHVLRRFLPPGLYGDAVSI